MEHTPEPWKLVERVSDFLIKTKNGCVIAMVHKFQAGTMEDQAKPNASLIVLAPQLLTRLERDEKIMRELAYKAGLLEEEVLDGDEFEKLRDLIAKAKGQCS